MTDTAERKVVAFCRGSGAVHRGVLDAEGRVTATCSCPGSMRGYLTKGIQVFPADKVTCKRGRALFEAAAAREAEAALPTVTKAGEPIRHRQEGNMWVVELQSPVHGRWICQGEFATEHAAKADLRNWV
jgi:hypothetical protein